MSDEERIYKLEKENQILKISIRNERKEKNELRNNILNKLHELEKDL